MLLSRGLMMGQPEAHMTGAGLSIMHCLAECPGLELRSTPVSRPACAEHWRTLLIPLLLISLQHLCSTP